eukprot:SAG11_NODE_8681_length_987_cov_2.177928_2_plen_61_part_00
MSLGSWIWPLYYILCFISALLYAPDFYNLAVDLYQEFFQKPQNPKPVPGTKPNLEGKKNA